MKHYVTWLVMAITAATIAMPAQAQKAVSFELDEAAPVEYDATETPADQDPNAEEFKAPAVVKARPVATAAPKQPATPAKPKPQPPRDIPLIESQNEMTSSDDVTFVTGGIGEEERTAIEQSKAQYNLYITNTSADGSFIGDARVKIWSVNKEVLVEKLNVVAGPLLYVRLPAGRYSVSANLGDQSRMKELIVTQKGQTAPIAFVWKTAN